MSDSRVFIPYNTKTDLDKIDNQLRDIVRWRCKKMISKKGYQTIMRCLRTDYQRVKKSIAQGDGFWVTKEDLKLSP